jgi:hypothetical protein
VDPEEEAQLEVAAPTGVFAGSQGKDFKTLAAGTAQNIIGLVIFVVGTFGANILISRAFGANGPVALGIVTLGTQFAFIAAAGTRFGMDMASVRYVAIEVGAGHPGRVRPVVTRAAIIAGTASVVLAVLTFAVAGPIGRALGADTPDDTVAAIRAGAIAIPFVALTYTWLGGSRGLKVMRHTLYVQWVAQPLLWIALMLVLWRVIDKTVAVRRILDHRGAGRVVLLGNDQPRLRAGGARRGADRQDRSLRGAPRDGGVVVAGIVLDRLLRRVLGGDVELRDTERARGLLGVRARCADHGAVPDGGVLRVRAVRGRPARARRDGTPGHAVQDDHALDRGRHDPGAAAHARDPGRDPRDVRQG